MLPCQQNCPNYTPGCHQRCAAWKELQAQRARQRQLKKAYLDYYNELCTVRTHQFLALSPVWR